MSPVAVLDIVIPQGSTYRLVINVVGGPADLSAYEAAMQVRPAKASSTVYADVTAGAVVVDDLNRQVVVTIPSSQTADYDWDEGFYDVLLTGPSGDWRLVEGRARLSGSVTRED